MDPEVLSMLTSIGKDSGRAGAGLLTALVQNALPMSRSQKEQNAWSERQAEVAYERQNEFYQNHQSIGAKVAEAQEAGVNPAAIYGNVGGSSAPSVPQASSSSPSVPDLVSAVTNMVMRGKELDLQKLAIDADVRLKDSAAAVNDAQANYLASRTKGQDIANEIAEATKTTNIEIITESLNKLKKEVDSAEFQKQILAHGVSRAYFESLITEIEYLYQNSTYFDRVNLAHYVTMYQKAVSEGEETRARNMQRLLDAQISEMYSTIRLNNATADQTRAYIQQYFEHQPGKKSLFQKMTDEQIQNLKSSTEFNNKNGEFVLSHKAKVDKETEMAWLEYVNSFSRLAVPIITGTAGFLVGGPVGAAAGAGIGYTISSTM